MKKKKGTDTIYGIYGDKEEQDMFDLVIVGTGPAGLAASIYARRAELNMKVIEEKPMSGGQIVDTYEVDNYPGIPGVNGFDLAMKMREHAEKLGVEFTNEAVTELDVSGDVKKVVTNNDTYEAKTVIVATGAMHAKLGVPGEEEFAGQGVSYCATCDGAFFRGKTVAVIGGGDVAVEDAIFLSRMAEKVYVVHRRDELRATKTLQTALFALDNVEMIWDSELVNITGDGPVSSIRVRNKKTEVENEIAVNGVFIAVGINPVTSLLDGKVDMDRGYIVANEDCATKLPGVFVAGDARKKQLRQIITAAADGANAVTSVENYLSNSASK